METTSDTEYRAENDGIVVVTRPSPIDTTNPNIDGFDYTNADEENDELVIHRPMRGKYWDQLMAFALPLFFLSFCLDPGSVSGWSPIDWAFIIWGFWSASVLVYRIRYEIRCTRDMISLRRILCTDRIACEDVQAVYVDHHKTLLGHHNNIPYHFEDVRVWILLKDGSVFIPVFGHNIMEYQGFLDYLDKRFPHCIQHGTVNDGNLPDWAAARQYTCNTREHLGERILLGSFLVVIIVAFIVLQVLYMVRKFKEAKESD